MLKRILDQSKFLARGISEDFKLLLSPPLCLGCDGDLPPEDPIFCRSCLEALKSKCPGFGPVCPICGRFDFAGKNCRFCHADPPLRLYYWGRYDGELVEYITAFKFRGVLELGLRLTEEAVSALFGRLDENHYDYVIPVPLHKSRRRKREYNQSGIIARKIAEILKSEYISDSVFRVRSTRQQAKIRDDDKRWKNVRDAFSISEKKFDFEGKRVLIVDDIVTTGATIYEVSRPIREQKPEMLDVFSLAYAG
jgi:ComF family protein